MNKVIIIGNLTRDPETFLAKDTKICKFSIAVTRRFNREEADFLNIVTFKGLADNCERFLSKGKKVAVSGHIQTGSYEKEGQRVYTTEIVADEVEFLTKPEEKVTQATLPPTGQAAVTYMQPIDEDLPF